MAKELTFLFLISPHLQKQSTVNGGDGGMREAPFFPSLSLRIFFLSVADSD